MACLCVILRGLKNLLKKRLILRDGLQIPFKQNFTLAAKIEEVCRKIAG